MIGQHTPMPAFWMFEAFCRLMKVDFVNPIIIQVTPTIFPKFIDPFDQSLFFLELPIYHASEKTCQEIEEPLLKCLKKQYIYKNEIKFYIYYFVIYSGNLLNLYIASHCFFSASIVCRCWDMTRCVKASLRLVFTFICIPPAMKYFHSFTLKFNLICIAKFHILLTVVLNKQYLFYIIQTNKSWTI